jgi:DNA (cytosine-5)-methyltransferase 1
VDRKKKQEMHELALFAGAGGGLLATKWLLGWETVCYVEKEEYPVRIIKARIRDGLLDDAPIWSDVRSFTKRNNQARPFIRQLRAIRGSLVVTAGFPCQPFSLAGKSRAEADERNGWPDTVRIIREIRPAWVFLENVPGLLAGSHGYYGTILQELAQSGYDARWRVLSAAEMGAPHQRDRLWIVAHAQEQHRAVDGPKASQPRRGGEAMADSSLFGSFRSSTRPAAPDQKRHNQARQQGGATEFYEAVPGGQTLAHTDRQRQPQQGWSEQKERGRVGYGRQAVGDPECQGLAIRQGVRGNTPAQRPAAIGAGDQGGEIQGANTDRRHEMEQRVGSGETGKRAKRSFTQPGCPGPWWATEPDVGRVADGVASRVDRLKALGNGQVPDVAALAWVELTKDLL